MTKGTKKDPDVNRKLTVNYVIVNGTTYQATGPMIIDYGSGSAAFDGDNVAKGTNTVPIFGALRFVAGAGGTSMGYDKNGNMTYQLTNNQADFYSYDGGNHLISVRRNGATLVSYTYDGNGSRITATANSVTTNFIGNYYEWVGNTSTATPTAYYFEGSLRVAMRSYNLTYTGGQWVLSTSTLYYLLADYLGSTSVTASSLGGFVSETRYAAWGEVWYSSGTPPIRYGFIGQYISIRACNTILWQRCAIP